MAPIIFDWIFNSLPHLAAMVILSFAVWMISSKYFQWKNRVEKVEKECGKMDVLVVPLSSKVPHLETRVEKVEKEREKTDSLVTPLSNKVPHLENRVERVEKEGEKMDNAIILLCNNVSTLSNRVDKIEYRVEKIEYRVEKIEEKIDNYITPTLNRIEKTVADLSASVTKLSSSVAVLSTSFKSLIAYFKGKDESFDADAIISKSPIKLSELGEKLLVDSGGKKLIDENLDVLIEEMDKMGVKTALDAQMYTSLAIASMYDSDHFTGIKNYIYNNPFYKKEEDKESASIRLTLDMMSNIMGIYLRDKYLERNTHLVPACLPA